MGWRRVGLLTDVAGGTQRLARALLTRLVWCARLPACLPACLQLAVQLRADWPANFRKLRRSVVEAQVGHPLGVLTSMHCVN